MIKRNLFYLFLTLGAVALTSCEEVNQAQFQHAYKGVADDTPADARRAMDTLTRGGRTLPSGNQLADTISNPGDCAACNAAANPAVASGNQPNYYPSSLKNYPIPSAGCINKDSISGPMTDRLIQSQGLRTENATAREKRSLAAAIMRVQQLNGGPLRMGMGPGRNYPFKFKDANGSWQDDDGIHIGRGDHDHGNSVAQHVHEWAHLIGNQGGYEMFKEYMGGGGSYNRSDYCLVSGYADNVTRSGKVEGEQFAEVLAAFVTQPSLLLNNRKTPNNCKKVFNFFRDKFFKKGSLVNSCL